MNDLSVNMYEADIKGGRPSVAPEKLLRAMLLQVLYSCVPSECSLNKFSTTCLALSLVCVTNVVLIYDVIFADKSCPMHAKVFSFVTLALFALSSNAQTYNRIGNTTYGSNRTTLQQIGNTTYSSSGTTYQQISSTTYSSTGYSYQQIGNTTYGSNGTTSQQIGNTTFINGPDGLYKTCQHIGGTTRCN